MSYQLDFFGKPLRRPGPRAAPPFTGDLFEGAAWTWAAEQWAKDNGLAFEGWTIARRFKAGGRWYAVSWDGRTQAWDIRPAVEGDTGDEREVICRGETQVQTGPRIKPRCAGRAPSPES